MKGEIMSQNKREKPIIDDILSYNSIILGFMGHVDSGKTSIAKNLSEIISTAGLDAHPQSKERGITIDLGFTSFILNSNLITLVDAPGHADLIRSVIASGNIIDGAILVVDGKEGVQIQTVEHLVILESLGISDIIIVINKIDLVDKQRISEIEKQLKKNLSTSIFGNKFPIVQVSALKNNGFEALKQEIGKLVKKINAGRKGGQNFEVPAHEIQFLRYPIDHHLKIKGIGTVVTGTLLEGNMKTGETYTILPQKRRIKIKSLQVFHQNVDYVPRGFRVGAAISGIETEQIYRGNIITNQPIKYQFGDIVEVDLQFNNYFKRPVEFGTQVNITTGLITSEARIFPFMIFEGKKMVLNQIGGQTPNKGGIWFDSYLWINKPMHFREGEKVILSQLDLPPTTLRFFGSGTIRRILPIHETPELFYEKEKIGRIKDPNYGKKKILVEGLAQSKRGAETLVGKYLNMPTGKIEATFGNKGVIIVSLSGSRKNLDNDDSSLEAGDKTILKLLRKMQLRKEKSYQ
jgi:selenocysteine-specific elongation factor